MQLVIPAAKPRCRSFHLIVRWARPCTNIETGHLGRRMLTPAGPHRVTSAEPSVNTKPGPSLLEKPGEARPRDRGSDRMKNFPGCRGLGSGGWCGHRPGDGKADGTCECGAQDGRKEQRGREGAGREGRAGGEGQREVKGQIRGTYPAGNGEPWRVLQQSGGGACVLEQRVLVSSVRTFWRVC